MGENCGGFGPFIRGEGVYEDVSGVVFVGMHWLFFIVAVGGMVDLL